MRNAIKVGIIGDFNIELPSHQATTNALEHCAEYLGMTLELQWLSTESLEDDINKELSSYDALWCAPGSPYKSMKGALEAIRFARENDYPFIGTCAGFQHAVIEYAQNNLGLNDVQHAEYNPNASKLLITPLSCSLAGKTSKIFITSNTKTYKIYNKTEIEEYFTCNYGLNPSYQTKINESGFKVVGTDRNGEARILELPENQFYIATLFQPQLSSLPSDPHPLIIAYLTATNAFHLSR